MTRHRSLLIFAFLIFLTIFLSVINLSFGSADFSFFDALKSIFSGGQSDAAFVIFKIRLPRLFAAFLLGGALALSGLLLQIYFQNPVAGPFVLGISSGAKLFVAIFLVFFAGGAGSSSALLIFGAFLGAVLSTAFILLVAKKISHPAVLLVAGIMIGYCASSVTEFVITFAQDADIVNLHGWTQGSFSGITMENILVIAPLVLISFLLILLLSKSIGAFNLGENYARSMGVRISLMRPLLILLSSLLSASVAAFAGSVSFVGIAVPFLIRRISKTANALFLIPAVFLGGGSFCLLCDLIARSVFSPLELSISAVTSLFGAPVVIFILLSRRRQN